MNILICITGSVAAYKVIDIAKMLKKCHEIKIIMTQSATKFVTPLMLQLISNNKVYKNIFNSDCKDSLRHITLARWSDIILIVPATANTIAKIAHGIAEDLLGNVILAANSNVPIYIAPAMNTNMWNNIIVRENINKLSKSGFKILQPKSGRQVCGDIGYGKLMSSHLIVDKIMLEQQRFNNIHVMITLGATLEPIDPIRYISNHSSGKMGIFLAKHFVEEGCKVSLISGTTKIDCKVSNVYSNIKVRTADEMYKAVHTNIKDIDIFISAAAVVDFKVKKYSTRKIKKDNDNHEFLMKFEKNKDIIKSVSNLKIKPICVGFAAETHNHNSFALNKLKEKNLDLIILNKVNAKSGYPFDHDSNEVEIYTHHSKSPVKIKRARKVHITKKITEIILKYYNIGKKIKDGKIPLQKN